MPYTKHPEVTNQDGPLSSSSSSMEALVIPAPPRHSTQGISHVHGMKHGATKYIVQGGGTRAMSPRSNDPFGIISPVRPPEAEDDVSPFATV